MTEENVEINIFQPLDNQNNEQNKYNDKEIDNKKNLSINKKDFEIWCCCCKKYIIKNFNTLYDIIISSQYERKDKQIILARIQRIYKKIRKQQVKNKFHYISSKIFIIFASILSPAITSLNTDSTTTSYVYLWWFVWTLQIGISIVASLSSFFKWDHKYFLYAEYKDKIELEIWNFLENNNEYNREFEDQTVAYKYNLSLFYHRLENLYKSVSNKDNKMENNQEDKKITKKNNVNTENSEKKTDEE